MDFRVDLGVFRGPMDLLLYLVRKHELEIVDIPIAEIAEQYLQYIAVLEQLDVDAVGDFLALAATLIEIKSQQVLPRSDEIDEEIDDPRAELVARLLEYKKYRDAASVLEEQSRRWQQQYARLGSDLAAAATRFGGGVDPGSRVVGPRQRVCADSANRRDVAPVQYCLRRHADPRLHGPHRPTARADRRLSAGRGVRGGHAQVAVDRALPGGARVGAALPGARRAGPGFSAKSGSCREKTAPRR